MTMQGMANSQAPGQDWRPPATVPVKNDPSGKDTAVALGLLSTRISGAGVRFAPAPRELLAQCPNCKTMETLLFVGTTLLRCRRFRQEGGRIYHDCGSDRPCRLHE